MQGICSSGKSGSPHFRGIGPYRRRDGGMVPLAWRRGIPIARTSISISGIVQGVGFRPFVYRLAAELGLTGWVRNSAEGVLIEACGTEERLAHFTWRIRNETPPLAVIVTLKQHA